MNEDTVQKLIEDILKLMGVSFESVSWKDVDGKKAFVIKSPDSHMLIGSRGSHISALNHIVKKMVSQKLDVESSEKFDFYVDVNDYHDRLVREIHNKANILAGRARSFKTNVDMDPMSSYERLIVHSLFQDASDIKTESSGVGHERHVVIKYYENPTEGENF